MNNRFQKLIARVPDKNDDDIELIIEPPLEDSSQK